MNSNATRSIAERALVRAAMKPLAQLLRVARRQTVVMTFARQLDHRLRPQPAVEMFVQENFWELLKQLSIERHAEQTRRRRGE
jgi:hypothetical protein